MAQKNSLKKINELKKIFLTFFFLLFFYNHSLADSVRVIDGDTIEINKEKFRFANIDTPEKKQICFLDSIEIFCGNLATIVLKAKIGQEIPQCKREGEDHYKRILAECFVNGESLSKFLVRSGYAFAFRKYSDKFIEDENFAKENKLGLWAMKFEYPWDFRKKN